MEAAREKLANSGVRPTHKTGFLGLTGARVDSTEHYEQALRDVNDKLAQLEVRHTQQKKRVHDGEEEGFQTGGWSWYLGGVDPCSPPPPSPDI